MITLMRLAATEGRRRLSPRPFVTQQNGKAILRVRKDSNLRPPA